MSFSPLDSALYGPSFGTAAFTELFSDDAHLRRLVKVEVALAGVQAELGLIPTGAAAEIARVCPGVPFDFTRLRSGLAADGVPVTGVLAQLREHLGEEARAFLHWGATTQDIVDTALILALREALDELEGQLERLISLLAGQAERHRRTVMAGRTHSQQALPVTFGLKVAGWLAPLLRHRNRLAELRPRLLSVQFGGAAGTLAALGGDGGRVQEALAVKLGLNAPLLPWHTARDNLAELAGWLALVTGSLGKFAQDVILLAQTEVGELRESADRSRGGSSTMPQKSNPMTSEAILAAARMNAVLVSGMYHALIQEHERGTHGWQVEWLTLPQMLGLCAGALRGAEQLAGEMAVDVERMRENVAASGGLMLAEGYSFLLTPLLGRTAARTLVTEAVKLALAEGFSLHGALSRLPGAPPNLPELREEDYLGENDLFIDRVLSAAQKTDRSMK